MAKISINKALQLAPRDPQVLQAKQELERGVIPAKTSKSKTASKKPSDGIFGLFGKK